MFYNKHSSSKKNVENKAKSTGQPDLHSEMTCPECTVDEIMLINPK